MTFIHELIFFNLVGLYTIALNTIEVNFEWYQCYIIAGWHSSSKKITGGCFERAASMLNSGDHRKCVSRKASPATLDCHCNPGGDSQKGTLLSASRARILLPRSPLQKNRPPFSVPSQSHSLHYFWRSTPIMIFRPYFYSSSIHRHPHSPGLGLTHGHPISTLFIRGRYLLSCSGSHGSPSSFPLWRSELPVDRALVAGEPPGYLF